MEKQPWERQRDPDGKLEPALWYGRFTAFRLMGTDRSLLGCYKLWLDRMHKKRPVSLPRAPTAWQSAALRWEWHTRAEVWDEYVLQEDEAEWLRRQAEIREQEWVTAMRLLEKAELMLNFPVARSRVEGENVIVEPAGWRLRDVAAIVMVASKLARLAVGMETARGSLDVTSEGEQAGRGYAAEQRVALLMALYDSVQEHIGQTTDQGASTN